MSHGSASLTPRSPEVLLVDRYARTKAFSAAVAGAAFSVLLLVVVGTLHPLLPSGSMLGPGTLLEARATLSGRAACFYAFALTWALLPSAPLFAFLVVTGGK